VKKVEKMVTNDRRIRLKEVADEVGITIASFHNIFSNVLGMKRAAAKFVPKLLNFIVTCS
jgi:AraC-like DNA-binding protein